MKLKYILLSASIFWASALCFAGYTEDTPVEGAQQSCTSIIVGRKASTDGSVITSHTCDGKYRTWLSIEPARDNAKGAKRDIFKYTMKTASRADSTGIVKAGEIPEAAHCYAYLNTAYPCLNEKQLGIGETTFGGPDTLRNPDSMFLIEELERIALERCSTAKEAVLLMGSLAEKYGYADGGECLTVADKNEIWYFEIIGCGKDKTGAVWVAKRLPDDHIGVSANVPRIGILERKDKSNFLCSDNVESVAVENGLWDGKGEFKFWKVYKAEYARGKNFRERDWFILNAFAPSLGLTQDMDELPFSVKPDNKVSVQDVFAMLREYYEGTPIEMCRQLTNDKGGRNILANPWMSTEQRVSLNAIAPGIVEFQRNISVAWCSYSTVIQLRGWLPDNVGGICYYAVDNPGQSPRVPIFCGNTELPEAYSHCGQNKYDDSYALWQFRKANKLATVNWPLVKDYFMGNVNSEEDRMMETIRGIGQDATPQTLNAATRYIYESARDTWREMEEFFWVKFGLGF